MHYRKSLCSILESTESSVQLNSTEGLFLKPYERNRHNRLTIAEEQKSPTSNVRLPISRCGIGSQSHFFTISTRRFFARPSSVLLSAIGFSCPQPVAVSLALSTPREMMAFITDFALFSESVLLNAAVPTLSVCPSMPTRNESFAFSMSAT